VTVATGASASGQFEDPRAIRRRDLDMKPLTGPAQVTESTVKCRRIAGHQQIFDVFQALALRSAEHHGEFRRARPGAVRAPAAPGHRNRRQQRLQQADFSLKLDRQIGIAVASMDLPDQGDERCQGESGEDKHQHDRNFVACWKLRDSECRDQAEAECGEEGSKFANQWFHARQCSQARSLRQADAVPIFATMPGMSRCDSNATDIFQAGDTAGGASAASFSASMAGNAT
jgi:hypothetical protein